MIKNPSFLTFIGYILTLRLAHYAENGYAFGIPDVEIEEGPKFLKVLHVERDPVTGLKRAGGSVNAFVAVKDFSNRGLGEVKAGDVFKSASFRAPAKTKRGNIFDEDNGTNCYGAYGPCYLRN